MSDLAQRLVKAVAKAIHDENPYDLPADLPGLAPSELGLAEVAAEAMLRELDRIYHERDSSFEQLDVAALADEIATHTDQETPR